MNLAAITARHPRRGWCAECDVHAPCDARQLLDLLTEEREKWDSLSVRVVEAESRLTVESLAAALDAAWASQPWPDEPDFDRRLATAILAALTSEEPVQEADPRTARERYGYDDD